MILIAGLNHNAQADVTYQDQQNLHEIVKQISPKNIETDVMTLVDFGTRHTNHIKSVI